MTSGVSSVNLCAFDEEETYVFNGVFNVYVSSQQRSLLLTERSACGSNGLSCEERHIC